MGNNAGRRNRMEGYEVKSKRKKGTAIVIQLPKAHVDCIITPQELTGIYQYDFCNTADLFKQDLTNCDSEVAVNLALTFVNINDSYKPIRNSRVNVWCGDQDSRSKAGTQMTDCNGQVIFKVSPSSLLNEAIHFELYLNGMLKTTSELSVSDLHNIADSIADGFCGMTIGVEVPNNGIITLTPETGGQFILEQNHSNPVADKTTIGFTLLQESKALLEIFDTSGRKVESLVDASLEAGFHKSYDS